MYVVTDMQKEVTKYNGAPTAKPTSEGTGNANSVSTSAQKIIFVAFRSPGPVRSVLDPVTA
ncbi:MAG: hypothetical protein STSR0009_30150 [Methanoregula sp.]